MYNDTKTPVGNKVEIPDSIIVPVTLNIDVGAKSSMFCCIVCLDIIQTPVMHRQCHLCGNTVCTGCIKKLSSSDECPLCREKTVFIANSLIHREIYPMVSKSCPWPKCNVRLLNVDEHMARCRYRTVQCPVCHVRTSLMGIHEHLNRECALPWKDIQRDSISSFVYELKNVGRIPRGNYQKIFDLNPAGTKDTSENTRLIYFWRKNNPKRGFIRMICIQLCAIEDENIGFATDRTGSPVCMDIASMENFDQVEPTVKYADEIAEYKSIGIEPGIHLLTCGDRYEIKHTTPADGTTLLHHMIADRFRSFKGQLIEILWNPPRAVFVDRNTNIRTITIVTSADMNCIKKITSVDDSTLSTISGIYHPETYQSAGSQNRSYGGRPEPLIYGIPPVQFMARATRGQHLFDMHFGDSDRHLMNHELFSSATQEDPSDHESSDEFNDTDDDLPELMSPASPTADSAGLISRDSSEHKDRGIAEMERASLDDESSPGGRLEPAAMRLILLAIEASIIRARRNNDAGNR